MSQIQIKKKRCKGCETDQYIWARGKCKKCVAKEQTVKINSVRQIGSKGSGDLQRWFEDRRKEMDGVCKHCGGQTQAFDDNYKCSVAHILPKAYFKSVATHPSNFVELCFYGKSCHTNLDNYMLDLTELNCFDEVIQKFVKMYPDISKEERRRIPSVLLQYIETEI